MSSKQREEFQGTERFAILRRLGAGGMGIVYEAYDRERSELVALKVLREAGAGTILQFKQEFRSIAQTVHPNLIPLYEFFSDGHQWFFTMELLGDAVDFVSFVRQPTENSGGRASGVVDFDLSTDETIDTDETDESSEEPPDFIPDTPVSDEASPPPLSISDLDLDRLRSSLRQLVEGTRALHDAGILHRDLKPENVLVRANGCVTLLDFGLVAELSGRGHDHSSARPRRDTAKSVDETDRRIVGSIGYMSPEQASALPLTPASDWYAVGVILYLALTGRRPFPGHSRDLIEVKRKFDPPAPDTLFSGIPDDLNDLCVDLLQRNPAARPDGAEILARLDAESGEDAGTATDRPVHDANVPEQPFVGRRPQLELLSNAFERVREGATGIYRVHGRSGAGKSALIDHFLNGLSKKGDVVILSGRCYEQESVPYKAFDSLIDALTAYLLKQTPVELDRLLPSHVAALARIFPVLRRVDAIESDDHGSTASDIKQLRHQAFEALRRLLVRIGERHHLVIYVDDLQWGDADSGVMLRQLLCDPDSPRMLMVISYRMEHVDTSECLRALANLSGDSATPFFEERMLVEALNLEETHALALELLTGDPEAETHAEWVVRESGGSAFFVHELVQRVKHGLEKTESEGLHLDEILWQRIQRLPDQARRLLEVVSMAGGPIRLRDAQEAAGFPSLPSHVVGALRSEHLLRSTGPRLTDDVETYHDRIRESVVEHLTDDKRKQTHRTLAKTLLANGDPAPEVLAMHMAGAGERDEAGRHYETAADQAVRALAFGRVEDFYRRALSFASEEAGRARIYEKLVHFYTDLARFEDAYRAGREGARIYGINLPRKFNPRSFVVDLVAARLRIGFRDVTEILNFPTMSDERLAGGVRLIGALAKAAYQIRPELCVAVNARMVNLCLKHGNTPDAAIGYMVFGSIFLGGVLGKYQRGYEFGRLALDLVEKYDNVKQRAEVNFVVGYFGTSWLRPAVEAEKLWSVAHESGLATGDLFHTGCAGCATILSYFMRGVPMQRIMEESERDLALLLRVGQREPAGAVMAVRQAIRNLRGETVSGTSFSDSAFDEDEYVEEIRSYGSRHFAHYYYIVKMQALYFRGEYEAALVAAEASTAYLKESKGMLHSAEHHLYHALILTALAAEEGGKMSGSRRRAIRSVHGKFKRWAGLCPSSFLHKERLLAAEIARVAGDTARAAPLFDAAAAAAKEHGYLQIEAVARKRRAQLDGAAGASMNDADECFRRWGAEGLVD